MQLAAAREAARLARAKVLAGIHPAIERKEARSALAAAAASAWTFDRCAEAYITAMAPKWRGATHEQQWTATLATYASPVMGKLLVRDIGLAHVLQALEPIWQTKTETAARVRGRIESVIDYGITRGYATGPNPARWKGNLDSVLPAASRVKKVEHHAALPVGQVGAFMQAVRQQDDIYSRALEFAILTAARSGEVRGATWQEIDFDKAVWTVPGERMKALKPHAVPLSKAAVALLKALPRGKATDYVFPAVRGGMLSSAAMTGVITRLNAGAEGVRWTDPKNGSQATPHGFRSTFRDWASEVSHYPADVAEQALAHTIGSKVEAAYRRGDLFEKRKLMMSEWATFVGQVQSAKVTPIRSKKASAAATR